MARGTEIIVSSDPAGKFKEGTIGDASLPGALMMLQAGTAFTSGEPTWVQCAPAVDGAPFPTVVLLNDWGQGKTSTQAYTAGQRGFLYAPAPGELLNVLCTTGAGPNTVTIGDRLMIDDTSKVLIPTSGTPQSVSFQAMETITLTAPNIPGLVLCMFTGH